MRNKTLKRRVIIRECDYEKIAPQIVRDKLYDSLEFVPLTLKEMEHENIIFLLKNPEKMDKLPWPVSSINNINLWRLEHLCYNKQYTRWRVTVDYPDGQVWVQSRINVDPSRLGWGVFEKDI